MALTTLDVPPLDPYLFTGPDRLSSGVGRTGTVTTNTAYGEYARWIYVGVTGDVSYVRWDGTTQLLKNLAAGIWHPILSIMVNTTGTTATDLVWGS